MHKADLSSNLESVIENCFVNRKKEISWSYFIETSSKENIQLIPLVSIRLLCFSAMFFQLFFVILVFLVFHQTAKCNLCFYVVKLSNVHAIVLKQFYRNVCYCQFLIIFLTPLASELLITKQLNRVLVTVYSFSLVYIDNFDSTSLKTGKKRKTIKREIWLPRYWKLASISLSSSANTIGLL